MQKATIKTTDGKPVAESITTSYKINRMFIVRCVYKSYDFKVSPTVRMTLYLYYVL